MDLIGRGRDADVYALDDKRVLRRYRDGYGVVAEAEIMRHVAAHGVPVPQIFDANGPDLVMERIDGALLVDAVIAGEVDPQTAGETLASLQRGLHAVPPLIAAGDDDRILHLDLHPHNVFMTPAGPVLIDWGNAVEGPPALDVTVSALIIAEAVLGSFVPTELLPAVREMLSAYLGASGCDPLDHIDRARQYRRGDPNLDTAEIARLDDAGDLVADVRRRSA